jgi:hypothetical protein
VVSFPFFGVRVYQQGSLELELQLEKVKDFKSGPPGRFRKGSEGWVIQLGKDEHHNVMMQIVGRFSHSLHQSAFSSVVSLSLSVLVSSPNCDMSSVTLSWDARER